MASKGRIPARSRDNLAGGAGEFGIVCRPHQHRVTSCLSRRDCAGHSARMDEANSSLTDELSRRSPYDAAVILAGHPEDEAAAALAAVNPMVAQQVLHELDDEKRCAVLAAAPIEKTTQSTSPGTASRSAYAGRPHTSACFALIGYSRPA